MSDGDQVDDSADLVERLQAVAGMGCHSFFELGELAQAGFMFVEGGHWSLDLGGGIEVTLEPKIFGGHFLAVYRDKELVLERKLEVELRPRRQDG